MKDKFTYDNVVKGLITISLLFMAFGAKAADFSGKVGIASDNYFRGISISDGFGYSAQGQLDLGNGIWAGAVVRSMDENLGADYMTSTGLGYGFDLGGIELGVSYVKHDYISGGAQGWEDISVNADFGPFQVYYVMGQDDAGDYLNVTSSALKVIDLQYGDDDLRGSFFEVSKSFDLGSGLVKIGYIDHEDNDEDFTDKITDVDNFYVGYSYYF